jgi:methyl-accepting chemotaxis protein
MTLLNNQKHTLQEDLHTIFLSNISLVAALSPSLKTFSSKVRNIESVNDSLLSNNPHPSPDQFLTQYSDFIDIVSEFRENIASELTRLIQSRIENFSKTIHMNLTVVIIGLLLFSYLFSGVYLSIISNIYQLIRSSQEISKGNLDVKVQLETHDELSQVGHSFNMMRESLEQLVKNIKIATEAVRRESEEIALGNSDLAKRTIQQVTTLEETSGAMGKIADTVKQNSENAKGSYIHAQSATDIAYRGRTVVKKMVDMMNAINASAHQITDIIDVIDNIAFQTNILALNAAVEAARAGEQGRGFSVVSAEIRNLSKRSSEAAHGIKTLINNSVEQIQEGTKLGDQTLFTMEEIIKSVNNVTTIMSEIANASIEQSAGIQQINIAISEMDKVTQQNSALVEEAARAAHTLEKEAIHMNDLLDIFKTSRHKNKNLHKGPRREDPKRHEKPSLIQKLTSNNTTAPTTSSSQNDEWKEF